MPSSRASNFKREQEAMSKTSGPAPTFEDYYNSLGEAARCALVLSIGRDAFIHGMGIGKAVNAFLDAERGLSGDSKGEGTGGQSRTQYGEGCP